MKNLLLISVDSLRADACGFDSGGDATPYLDQLADRGVAFENAIAPGSRTPSSMPPTFTGEYYRHDATTVRGRRQEINRHLELHQTLPERLSELGYTTVGFTANPWTATDTRFDTGFDEFYEVHPNGDAGSGALTDDKIISAVDTTLEAVGREDLFGWADKREWFAHWTGFHERIRERLADVPEPYFAWVFVMDTHQPYITPRSLRRKTNAFQMYYAILRFWNDRDEELPEYLVDWMRRSYRDAAHSADEFVRRMAEACDPEETVLVVHSDHGESHGEHDTYGHEYRLYEENIRVPLVIDGVERSENVAELFSLVDLPELLVDAGTTGEIEPGRCTADFVVSETESVAVAESRADMLNYDPHDVALRGQDWKFITGPETDELYHLAADPGETRNLAPEHPDLVADLRRLVERETATQEEKGRIVEAAGRISADSSL